MMMVIPVRMAMMVLMVMMVSVTMVMMIVTVVMVSGQQPGAGEVHGEPDHRNHRRFAELDRYGVHQAPEALVADEQGDEGEDDCAGERRELTDLAGPEREAGIVGVLAGEAISERRNGERCGMGRHVPAVGHQRHGPEDRPCDDLGDHHRRGQAYHEPGAPLMSVVVLPEEDVLVLPIVQGMVVHLFALAAST